MKNFQRHCATALLTLALTSPALAGYMHTGNTEPPPPPDSTQTTQGDIQFGAAGDIQFGAEGDMHTWNSEANAASMEAMLSLLQSVLPLF